VAIDEVDAAPLKEVSTWAERYRPVWEARFNRTQGGDPSKLANALLHLAGEKEPPAPWVAGADAVATLFHAAAGILALMAALQRDTLPAFAVPRFVSLLAELPRNAVGRVTWGWKVAGAERH
jgi:hypothetical protein